MRVRFLPVDIDEPTVLRPVVYSECVWRVENASLLLAAIAAEPRSSFNRCFVQSSIAVRSETARLANTVLIYLRNLAQVLAHIAKRKRQFCIFQQSANNVGSIIFSVSLISYA